MMKINLQLLAKTVTDDIINDVINGKYGNGQARKTALANAGYDYSEVQTAVNTKLGGKASTTPSVASPTTPTATTPTNVNNGFQYEDYMESDAVKNALAALDSHNAAKPADYQSKYGSLAEEAANAWANRDKFSYDLNGDALYQQYKDKYIQQGRLAMQDTIGQASAMTGGYGNSYAATAGNQAYQAHLQNLNDIVPQLYQMAYDQYNQEGQDMLNKYNLYNDMENQEYSRYRDTVSDWTSERDYLANAYNNERTYDRSIYDADKNFAYGTWSDDRNYNYQVGRDAVADAQWQATFDEGVRQFNETMQYNKSKGSGGSGSSGSAETYYMSKDEEDRLTEYIAMEDWAGADAYIEILASRGLNEGERTQWVAMIPQSYWDEKDKKKIATNTSKAEERYYNMKAKQADRM
jgi:hypothetical protein